MKVLHDNGWSEERNMCCDLVFTNEKILFPKFLDVACLFLGIKLHFTDRYTRKVTLFFDLDESNYSKDLRAQAWGYVDRLDSNIKEELDYEEYEDFEITSSIMKYISKKCARFGFLDDDLGSDLYISEDGFIYASHHTLPTLIARSFEEFLNNELTGNGQVIEHPDFSKDYNI